jgi:hypothetical protein
VELDALPIVQIIVTKLLVLQNVAMLAVENVNHVQILVDLNAVIVQQNALLTVMNYALSHVRKIVLTHVKKTVFIHVPMFVVDVLRYVSHVLDCALEYAHISVKTDAHLATVLVQCGVILHVVKNVMVIAITHVCSHVMHHVLQMLEHIQQIQQDRGDHQHHQGIIPRIQVIGLKSKTHLRYFKYEEGLNSLLLFT